MKRIVYATMMAALSTSAVAQQVTETAPPIAPPSLIVSPSPAADLNASPPGAGLSSAASPMVQSPAPSGPTLWRNIALGMTSQQVHALYPAGQHVKHEPDKVLLEEVPITPECEADVHIHHSAGIVGSVVIRGGGSLSGRCANRVLDALAARYGQSSAREERQGILRRPSQDQIWNRDGIMMRFRRFGGTAFGGGGLGRASWELTYSPVDTSIDL